MTKERYQSLPVKTLRELAKARGIRGMSTQKKAVIIDAMLELDAREAAAEEAAASEAKAVSQDIACEDQMMNSREDDTASVGTTSESIQTPPQKRVHKTEETEQAPPYEAAKKLARDFGIDPHTPAAVTMPKGKTVWQQRRDEGYCASVLIDYECLLKQWQRKYAPAVPEAPWDERFVTACNTLPSLSGLLAAARTTRIISSSVRI